MLISLKWLKDFILIEESPSELAFKLTMAGFEVEEIIDLKQSFNDCVVGLVTEVSDHPKADKLKVCKVSIGENLLNIVCGAPNVAKGQKVVVALPGAKLVTGNIEKTVIRDVESYGMLCSEKDLGFTASSTGIIVLNDKVNVGEKIWEEAYRDLDDLVLNINVTPNRGDCLSHLGIAREVSAITRKPLQYESSVFNLVEKADFVDIEIYDPDLCPRYTAMLIRNAGIGDAPDYMKIRLFACGMRSISNIVDITNYVMLDTGQPLHAFDYEKIRDKKIIVRKAKPGETIITLDGKERELIPDDLVIADSERAIAIAGVMGGLNTEVTEKTKTILLESAYFYPPSIRKTAKRLSIPSEASYRFERGVDISGVPNAAFKASSLMHSVCGGRFENTIVDCYPKKHRRTNIKFFPERCSVYLGAKDIMKRAEERLLSLGFEITKKSFEWDIIVPSYRPDVTIEEDVYEEIARLGFYEEIPPTLPSVKIKGVRRNNNDFAEKLRAKFVNFGGFEVINYSFIRQKELEKSRLSDLYADRLVYIKNPLTDELTVMRPSSVPSLLSVVETNHKRNNFDFFIFEVGKKYFLKKDESKNKPEEIKLISLAFSGNLYEKSWYTTEEPYDFFNTKGIIESVIDDLTNVPIEVKPVSAENYPFLNPASSCEIFIDNKNAGFLGLLHPDVSENYEFRRDIYLAELDYDLIKSLYFNRRSYYYGFSKFPSVDRDITVIVNEDLPVARIFSVIFASGTELLKNVRLTDMFKGEKIGAGRKSLTFKLIFQSMDRTLNDEEVNRENQQIAENLIKELAVDFPK